MAQVTEVKGLEEGDHASNLKLFNSRLGGFKLGNTRLTVVFKLGLLVVYYVLNPVCLSASPKFLPLVHLF